MCVESNPQLMRFTKPCFLQLHRATLISLGEIYVVSLILIKSLPVVLVCQLIHLLIIVLVYRQVHCSPTQSLDNLKLF